MCGEIKYNLQKIQNSLPKGVNLVAISKYHPNERILEAYNCGHRLFGENHEQELTKKANSLPKDIQWHFVGHLQTNKVKYIAPYISMIQSVDSLKLLKEINKQALKNERIIDVLLEIHIAKEETKFGLSQKECLELLDSSELKELNNVRICGLMTMASNVDDEQQIKLEFNMADTLYNDIKDKYFSDKEYFNIRSWGMSGDYKIACKCGSTHVRIGTAIFGEREY